MGNFHPLDVVGGTRDMDNLPEKGLILPRKDKTLFISKKCSENLDSDGLGHFLINRVQYSLKICHVMQ